MTRTLKEYVKEKFILSNYKKIILNENNLVNDMFIDIAHTFGYGEPKEKITKPQYYYDSGVQDPSGLYFYEQVIQGKKYKLAYLDYVNYEDIKREEIKKNCSECYGITIYTDEYGNLMYMGWSRNNLYPAEYSDIRNDEKRIQYDEYIKSLKNKNIKENILDNIKYVFIGELLKKKFYYGTDKNFYISEDNSEKIVINDSTVDYGYCKNLLSKITQNI